MTDRFIITATPPTPNGDFHVGHLSGPYLGADIFARFQRMQGADVTYVSSADRNQSYVVTTAERKGVDPDYLAASCHRDMINTLAAARISMDIFNPVDPEHIETVCAFMRTMERSGHIKRKIRQVPYSPTENRYLFESFVSGYCPDCWSPTAGAICEACGHPNDFTTLELAAPARSSGPIETRPVEICVLELENFRPQFERFYAEKSGQWRPHIVEFAREMLARPLPDYPLTYPSDWGIPAPFGNCEGQVLNVWAEMLPGLINSTAEASEHKGAGREAGLSGWRKDSDARIIGFLGYDNSFFFAFVHPALTWAHGDCKVVDTILTNEFFELENFKFSTSKNHLIWARDLLAERPADIVRYYLALANPEYQKMNFTRDAMDRLVEARLTVPFANAVDGIASAASYLGLMAQEIALDTTTAMRLDKALARFAYYHQIETFSPQRIAEHLSQLLVRMSAGVRRILAETTGREAAMAEFAYISGLLQIVLPAVTRPLMPDFSHGLASAVGRSEADLWPKAAEGCQIGMNAEQFRRTRDLLAPSIAVELRRAS